MSRTSPGQSPAAKGGDFKSHTGGFFFFKLHFLQLLLSHGSLTFCLCWLILDPPDPHPEVSPHSPRFVFDKAKVSLAADSFSSQ